MKRRIKRTKGRAQGKLCVLILVAVIALVSVQTSYSGDGPYDVSFISCSTSDNEVGKNVGTVNACIDTGTGGIVCSLMDAYPDYEAYVDFTIKNTGGGKIHVSDITINNGNPSALSIALSGITVGVDLIAGETVNGRITITALPGASESSTYSFSVGFTYFSS